MRVLAVLLAACLLLGCVSRPAPERRLYKRQDVGSKPDEDKPSKNFKAIDEMLSTLDQCFHVLEKAVDDCGSGKSNPTASSQELRDEKEKTNRGRTGIRKTEPTEPPTTPPTSPSPDSGKTVIIVHGEEVQKQTVEQEDAFSQAQDRDRGRNDGNIELPTPNVIVVHINRGDDSTNDEEEDDSLLPVLDRSRPSKLRKPTEAPTTPPTTLPPTENPPPNVIIIHTGGVAQDAGEEAEVEGLRRTETTSSPTQPPTQPTTDTSRSPPSVIIIHRDQPSDAEIESDVEYALQYWSRRKPTETPTQATQAPPTLPPRGPVQIIIIPDAHDESIDEIVSQVQAYSLRGRLSFGNRNDEDEEVLTNSPPTEVPVPFDGPSVIIVIDRRHYTFSTTSTETQTDPPTDSSHSAIKIINIAAQQSKMNNPLKPVKSQAKGVVDISEKDRVDLEREGMFMFPEAKASSRGGDKKGRNKTADGTDDPRGRNKATSATDLPTEGPSESATIETDASDYPTSDDNPQTSITPDTEEPTDSRDSQTDGNTPDSTEDTERPSDIPTTDETTDDLTDTEATDVSSGGTDSQSDTDSPDTPTNAPSQSTEAAEEAGEWPMEGVFFETPVKTAPGKYKNGDMMDEALKDYLHFRKRRQDDSSQYTAQECLQLLGSFIEEHYADKITFLNK